MSVRVVLFSTFIYLIIIPENVEIKEFMKLLLIPNILVKRKHGVVNSSREGQSYSFTYQTFN